MSAVININGKFRQEGGKFKNDRRETTNNNVTKGKKSKDLQTLFLYLYILCKSDAMIPGSTYLPHLLLVRY